MEKALKQIVEQYKHEYIEVEKSARDFDNYFWHCKGELVGIEFAMNTLGFKIQELDKKIVLFLNDAKVYEIEL